jgi:hypothetical protein
MAWPRKRRKQQNIKTNIIAGTCKSGGEHLHGRCHPAEAMGING